LISITLLYNDPGLVSIIAQYFIVPGTGLMSIKRRFNVKEKWKIIPVH